MVCSPFPLLLGPLFFSLDLGGYKGFGETREGRGKWMLMYDLWIACPNTPLEWGRATALYIKLASYATPQNCTDVDLVVEYV